MAHAGFPFAHFCLMLEVESWLHRDGGSLLVEYDSPLEPDFLHHHFPAPFSDAFLSQPTLAEAAFERIDILVIMHYEHVSIQLALHGFSLSQ